MHACTQYKIVKPEATIEELTHLLTYLLTYLLACLLTYLLTQYKIVKPEATIEELEAAVEDPKANEIFTQQFFHGNQTAARTALADIQV